MEVTKRSKDTVVCPIVYGSMAFYLGKNKSQDLNTHRWSLFIRGPNDEDLSIFVSKVAFSLHESFAEPVRVIEKAPFEVSELGWGEFAAKIRIFFKDPGKILYFPLLIPWLSLSFSHSLTHPLSFSLTLSHSTYHQCCYPHRRTTYRCSSRDQTVPSRRLLFLKQQSHTAS